MLTEDTFEGESLGAHWTVCDCGDASRVSVAVAGGTCEVTGTSNEFIRTSPNVFDRYPVGPVQSVGLDDFDVSIQLVTHPGTNQHAGLFFIDETDNRPGKYFFFGEEGANVVVNHYEDGIITGADSAVGPEADYLRLKREDTGGGTCTITCFTSADGTTWTQAAQYTGVALWSAFVGFCAGFRTLSASIAFEFDNFSDLLAAGSADDHEFGATGQESTSEQGAGDVTQGHAYGAAGQESTAEQGTGDLVQAHSYGATGGESATEQGTGQVTQQHAWGASGNESTSSQGGGALEQGHAFGGTGHESTTEQGTAEWSPAEAEADHQFGALAQESTTSQSLGEITQGHGFTAAARESLTEQGSGDLTQGHAWGGTSTESASEQGEAAFVDPSEGRDLVRLVASGKQTMARVSSEQSIIRATSTQSRIRIASTQERAA